MLSKSVYGFLVSLASVVIVCCPCLIRLSLPLGNVGNPHPLGLDCGFLVAFGLLYGRDTALLGKLGPLLRFHALLLYPNFPEFGFLLGLLPSDPCRRLDAIPLFPCCKIGPEFGEFGLFLFSSVGKVDKHFDSRYLDRKS